MSASTSSLGMACSLSTWSPTAISHAGFSGDMQSGMTE